MFDRTLDVHAGRDHLAKEGVHVPGIDLSTTYPLHDAAAGTASIDAWANGDGKAQNPVYARLYNPTVAGFEAGLAALEEAEAAVAFALAWPPPPRCCCPTRGTSSPCDPCTAVPTTCCRAACWATT